jgi:hypothetical protein
MVPPSSCWLIPDIRLFSDETVIPDGTADVPPAMTWLAAETF